MQQKESAEAECSRLHKDMSDLTASLERVTKGHITTQEELSLVREHLSVQTAEAQAALQRVQSLTAEVQSAHDQAAQLQLALDEAMKQVQAECAVAESARTQEEEAAAAVRKLKQQRSELHGQLASLQVCQLITLAFLTDQFPRSQNLLTQSCARSNYMFANVNVYSCPALLIAIKLPERRNIWTSEIQSSLHCGTSLLWSRAWHLQLCMRSANNRCHPCDAVFHVTDGGLVHIK